MFKIKTALTLTTLLLVLILSCNKSQDTNPCETKDCGDNGICLDGNCNCDEGYEGENCETEIREKFLGYWVSNDYSCGGGDPINLDFIIERGEIISEINFIYAYDPDFKLKGIYYDNIVIIPFQDYGTTYEGALTLNEDNSLSIEIEIDNGICKLSCTANAIRQ